MPFQIDGRGDMNAFVLTSPLAGVMLLTRRQPFYPSAAHDKFFSICTAFGGYTKFGIAPDLLKNHPQINIVDFEFFSINVFNQCENSDDIMMTIDNWEHIHPLLKTIPVDWGYTIPFGLLHSPDPSGTVQRFLDAIKAVFHLQQP